jgi:hypothetical protein
MRFVPLNVQHIQLVQGSVRRSMTQNGGGGWSHLGGGNELHGGGNLLGVLDGTNAVTKLLDGPEISQHRLEGAGGC